MTLLALVARILNAFTTSYALLFLHLQLCFTRHANHFPSRNGNTITRDASNTQFLHLSSPNHPGGANPSGMRFHVMKHISPKPTSSLPCYISFWVKSTRSRHSTPQSLSSPQQLLVISSRLNLLFHPNISSQSIHWACRGSLLVYATVISQLLLQQSTGLHSSLNHPCERSLKMWINVRNSAFGSLFKTGRREDTSLECFAVLYT